MKNILISLSWLIWPCGKSRYNRIIGPVIAVHKWFARRPGTLFRGLLLSEFGDGKLQDLFYQSNCLDGITVADPFMGGGTPVLEANRLGCKVIGCDINPMACWIVEREADRRTCS